jgi:hypothetical protein
VSDPIDSAAWRFQVVALRAEQRRLREEAAAIVLQSSSRVYKSRRRLAHLKERQQKIVSVSDPRVPSIADLAGPMT